MLPGPIPAASTLAAASVRAIPSRTRSCSSTPSAFASPSSLPRVMADPVRLTQALLNVLINAIQAVEKKGRVEVSAAVADGQVCVAVSDNGPGIPPDKLASVFDPYFTTKSEGSGLGLWIAQQIVTAHGGSLEAQNRPSGGAVVTMRLPMKREGTTV